MKQETTFKEVVSDPVRNHCVLGVSGGIVNNHDLLLNFQISRPVNYTAKIYDPYIHLSTVVMYRSIHFTGTVESIRLIPRTVVKCIFSDVLDTIGEGDISKGSTIFKSTFTDGCDCIRNYN